MHRPKISGLLNNCALYIALPILLEGIQQLADKEQANTLSDWRDNAIIEHYIRLKNIFTEHYQLDASLVNWQKLNAFLNSHTFYAQEIIFSPVLRNFIAEIAELDPTQGYQQQDLWQLRDIQDTRESPGRYNCLDPSEAAPLFYQPFGISLETYEFNSDENTFHQVLVRPYSKGNYPFINPPTLKAYLKNAHYEMLINDELDEATDSYLAEVDTLNPQLAAIHDGLSTSQREYQTNRNLGQLIIYVRRTFLQQLHNPNPRPLDPQMYAKAGRRFHNETVSGQQTFAIILLCILYENKDPQAQNFLDQMKWLDDQNTDSAKEMLNELAKAIIESAAQLNHARVLQIHQTIETYQIDISQALLKTAQLDEVADELDAAIQELVSATSELTTNNALIPQIIQNANALSNPNRTKEDVESFQKLQQQVAAEPGWGQKILNLMLAVSGLAMILVASLGMAGTLGAAITVPMIASGVTLMATGIYTAYKGISFFNEDRRDHQLSTANASSILTRH